MKMKILGVLFICCYITNLVDGFSSGAPESACESLKPGHQAEPQASLSPFKIALNKIDTTNGSRLLNVTIMSDQGLDFAGFMIQARADNSNNPDGTFIHENTISAKVFTCGRGLNNTATHKNKNSKEKVSLVWEAPNDFDGILSFTATVVRDYSTFWTGIRSDRFRVRLRRNDPIETTSIKPGLTVGTIKTNAPVPTTNPPKLSSVKPRKMQLYNNCGSTKGCFGFPESCITSQNCIALMTYVDRDDGVEFELYTEGENWVAAGLSDDKQMGDDSVMECTYENGDVKLHASWNGNTRKGAQYRVSSDSAAIRLVENKYEDNSIYCKFIRQKYSTVEGVEFDLNKPYHLLLASGKTFKEKENTVGYHGQNKLSSAGKIVLSDVSGESKRLAKYIHFLDVLLSALI